MGKNYSEIQNIQKWMKENLLTKNEAAVITGQSTQAFNQSVRSGKIQPFYESTGIGPAKVNLYLKSDIEYYRDHKRKQLNGP